MPVDIHASVGTPVSSRSGRTAIEADGPGVGTALPGPAIVEEFGATTVVPPGWDGTVDGFGNLIVVAK